MSTERALAFCLAALLSAWVTQPFAARLRAEMVADVRAQPPAKQTTSPEPTQANPTLRVLFVGNTLTSENHMPAMLGQLAAAAHEARALVPVLEIVPGSGLREHLQNGRIMERLGEAPFDYVVLQDQSQRASWKPELRETEMMTPIRALDGAISRTGARSMLLATFARREGDFSSVFGDTYEAMQKRVDEGYRAVGAELGIPIVPVGRIWQLTRRKHPELPLWAPDGQHPSLAGSYLTACALLQGLYGRSPLDNPYVADLPEQDAHAIQTSVVQVMAQSGSTP